MEVMEGQAQFFSTSSLPSWARICRPAWRCLRHHTKLEDADIVHSNMVNLKTEVNKDRQIDWRKLSTQEMGRSRSSKEIYGSTSRRSSVILNSVLQL